MCSPLDRLMVDGLLRVGKQYGGKTGEQNPIAQIRPLKRIWDLSSSTITNCQVFILVQALLLVLIKFLPVELCLFHII